MPINPLDAKRGLKLQSPLGDELVCQALHGREQLSRLFSYHLDVLSLNRNIAFKDIVGQRVTATMELPEGGERHFDGFVTEFRYTGIQGQFASYEATVSPWLWFLTRTADCRIFQNQKVPDIVKSVFRDNGMSDFKDLLKDTYREWEYCVQYRESDLNFVCRLLEQEGIYFYFEHSKGKHMLVLCDGVSAHKPFPKYESVPYFPRDAAEAIRERDHIQEWSKRQEVVPGMYAIKDYDFKKPKVDLGAKLTRDRPHAYPIDKHEFFDYPGEYTEKADGENYVERRLQELQAQHERVHASGDARGMCAGFLFELERYPRKEENKEYLITAVSHHVRIDVLETEGSTGSGEFYHFDLEAIASSEQYRPERSTPQPVVQGAHSAVVVGPQNEEIYCDEFGRVKVQFHWDRYGKNDENSSCWMRVSNLWAGQGWGGIHIPRIGQEVLVGFLEGDPDQPFVMGRLYNAVNMPPYELPANKTQSGIKSRSSPGGSSNNFNELRFEDKKGKEEVYFQAEKNLNSLVKNSETRRVWNKRTSTIGTDRSSVGKVIEDTTVNADRQTTIRGNDYLDAATDFSCSDGRKVIVHNGDHKLEVPMGSQEMKTLMHHKTQSEMGDISREASLGKVTEQALQSIEFKVGANSIKVDQTGVTIKGIMVNIEAIGFMTIKGPIVKIN